MKNELGSIAECWIVSAIISYETLEKIRKNLNSTTIQNYIVGVGLPTSPEVLRTLSHINNDQTVVARIYLKNNLFHPKVYLFKKDNGSFIAYIGSANFTPPGLENNYELGIKITDQAICNEILQWYTSTFRMSEKITPEFINRYESTYKSRKEKVEQEQIITDNFIQSEKEIEFQPQFFKKHHFNAFRNGNWEDRSPKVNQERYDVVEKFKELDSIIFPQFQIQGLGELNRHYIDQYLTSSYFHKNGFTSNQLKSIWLHYGKPEEQIRRYQENFRGSQRIDEEHPQSFINHIRIQIIIHNNDIGIWLVMKDNACEFDRQNLKSNIENPAYLQNLFNSIQALNQKYWINYGKDKIKDVSNISNPDEFYNLIIQCSDRDYFIIGITYKPLDKELSINNIANTVLQEFNNLLPIYNLIRDKRFE